nr:transposase [Bradyrhizobium elkanii]
MWVIVRPVGCVRIFATSRVINNEGVLDRIAERVSEKPEILNRRREIVEHPFGTIKQWMNQGAFLMRGLENVRAEFSLTALVYNLRRALNILGTKALLAAVQA